MGHPAWRDSWGLDRWFGRILGAHGWRWHLGEFLDLWSEGQMFDPPYPGRIAVAGTPINMIPRSDKKYRNFLEWWRQVGRLKPDDPQGWSKISGPWVMRGRVEAISAEEWEAL